MKIKFTGKIFWVMDSFNYIGFNPKQTNSPSTPALIV